MAGPGEQISALMTCTKMYEGDLADTVLDREKYPEWDSECTRLVYAFPADEKLWEEYFEIRHSQGKAAATDFYRRNQAAMDAGAQIAWPARCTGRSSRLCRGPVRAGSATSTCMALRTPSIEDGHDVGQGLAIHRRRHMNAPPAGQHDLDVPWRIQRVLVRRPLNSPGRHTHGHERRLRRRTAMGPALLRCLAPQQFSAPEVERGLPEIAPATELPDGQPACPLLTNNPSPIRLAPSATSLAVGHAALLLAWPHLGQRPRCLPDALHRTLTQILQILSIGLFEKTPILQAFLNDSTKMDNITDHNQLSLFNF
jgi:hypothetical protein